MTSVDLITGFLGAGKTTFIRRYAEFLKAAGERIIIIENEFGKANIDSAFLRDIEDDHCDVEQLTGACICCGGKQKFENLLFTFSSCGYDRIIVEPSGIYDVDEFFNVLGSEPTSRWCKPGNIITIADAAVNREALTKESEYLMLTQLISAGAVVLSKVQLASDDDINKTVNYFGELYKRYGCEMDSSNFIAKDWACLTADDLERLTHCGYRKEQFRRISFDHNSIFDAVTIHPLCKDEAQLRKVISEIINSCENIFRIKGYVLDTEGNAYECNCTHELIDIRPAKRDNSIMTIIGTALDQNELESRFGIEEKR